MTFAWITFDYTLWVVLLGTSLLGWVSGSLGSFAVLRKQSLLGDAISHAALPGIAAAFLITQTKSPLVLLIGAMVAGWVGTTLMNLVINKTKIKQDAALGILLSVFFGFGLVLLTLIQRLPSANQAGLNTYLFGNASTLLREDVLIIFILGSLALTLLTAFWKEFKVMTFDKDYAQVLGLPIYRLEMLLTTLIVVAIVIGLQAVGVVLMSAMLIAPAAAARQWTDSLRNMVFIAAFFGAVSGMIGAFFSASVPKLPTGPMIVIVMSVFVFVSLLFAPNRGLLWGWVREHHARANIRAKAMLENLLLFSEAETDPFKPHDIAALTAIGRGPARRALKQLAAEGLAQNPQDDDWAITEKGLAYYRTNSKEGAFHATA